MNGCLNGNRPARKRIAREGQRGHFEKRRASHENGNPSGANRFPVRSGNGRRQLSGVPCHRIPASRAGTKHRVRLLADEKSDPLRAGGGVCRAGIGRCRLRVQFRHGGAANRAGAVRTRRPSAGVAGSVRRHVPADRAGARPFRARGGLCGHERPGSAGSPPQAEHEGAHHRNAHQSADDGDRHRPSERLGEGTGDAHHRGQHAADAVLPAAARTGGRRGDPQRLQVPGGPQRRAGRPRGGQGRGGWPNVSASCKIPSARCSDRRTAGCSCAE